jgi:hypothetical protein
MTARAPLQESRQIIDIHNLEFDHVTDAWLSKVQDQLETHFKVHKAIYP